MLFQVSGLDTCSVGRQVVQHPGILQMCQAPGDQRQYCDQEMNVFCDITESNRRGNGVKFEK